MLRLYNTLSRSVEPFQPIAPPRVTFYTCGPTIYNYAHIGNFRTFLFEDLLRRWLEASGYEVFHVMNLTDVDDRTIAAARARGATLREHVEPFARAFFDDRDYLRIRPAHAYPRATEYVGPMIALTQSLLDKGVAYRGEDGSVYFAIARFPAYGRLSRLDLRQLKTGASERVSADEYAKEDARDFVLWKAAKADDEAVGAAWDAPFGRGRPGWHLECSAMALDLIGTRWGADVLDIHAGGVDLIFPHHEDEIAQSCAHTGKPEFARYWLHGEFLDIGGTKMSKRYGNILTARDLREQGVDVGAIRLLMFQTHYQQRLDWNDEALAAAAQGSARLGRFRDRLAASPAAEAASEDPEFGRLAEAFRARFTDALDDNLNAPQALAAVFGQLLPEGNRLLDAGRKAGPLLRAAWALVEQVLDVAPAARTQTVKLTGSAALTLPRPEAGGVASGPEGVASEDDVLTTPPEVPPPDAEGADRWAARWAEVRAAEKRRRNFAEADRIRELLRTHGFEVRDARDGSIQVIRITPPPAA
ncbi:MAG: cysteine--tRNA ligase [Gemmatimonadota bacterium]